MVTESPAKRMKTEMESGEKESVKTFTDEEAALYDRQIRLWGVDAQKRLNEAKVLIIGLGGVGAEVAKNIILGGVKSVTLMDSGVLTELDAACQFLAPRDAVGQNRAEASLTRAKLLNPMVEVIADSAKPEDKPDNFFENFSVICVSNCLQSQACRINRIARQNGIGFFAMDVFGFNSFIFADLGEHHYKKEIKMNMITGSKKETAEQEMRVLDKVAYYIPYQDLLSIDWNLDDFASRVKKTNPGVYAIFVLLQFYEKHQRKPNPATREDDLQELLKIRDEYVEKNGISKEKCPDELFQNVFGELSPVCAITGGQLAHDVVKAISKKDDPLENFFVFNPVSGTGYVEKFV